MNSAHFHRFHRRHVITVNKQTNRATGKPNPSLPFLSLNYPTTRAGLPSLHDCASSIRPPYASEPPGLPSLSAKLRKLDSSPPLSRPAQYGMFPPRASISMSIRLPPRPSWLRQAPEMSPILHAAFHFRRDTRIQILANCMCSLNTFPTFNSSVAHSIANPGSRKLLHAGIEL